jgi:uridine monophosphate synthetase
MSGFFAKLQTAVRERNSLLCIGLDPDPKLLPARYRSGGVDPLPSLLDWHEAIISTTAPYTAVYKPNIAFYEALGATGLELLRQTLAMIPKELPVLLDAKRSDIGSTAAAYAHACFDVWGVDGVTVNPFLGRDSITPFTDHSEKGIFVLCHTSNPGSGDFQELEINDWRTLDREPNRPLYIHIARTVVDWGDNIGLVVGATYPDAIRQVRSVAPNPWFLVPGIGAQGGDLAATLQAGLRADGAGLLVNASRGIATADDHGTSARSLRDEINLYRSASVPAAGAPVSEAAPPSTAPSAHVHAELIEALLELEALKFGTFTLASGIQSPIYIDLRLLVSRPRILEAAAAAYAQLLGDIPCDRIAGVPYAALPIGTAVAIATNTPLIYPRKEAKAHGLGRTIEGDWQPGERVVVIEDLITSAGSIIQAVEQLRAVGLVVEHAIVLIDREQGGVANLAKIGVTAHAVLRLPEMLDHLVAAGRLTPDRAGEVANFLWQK